MCFPMVQLFKALVPSVTLLRCAMDLRQVGPKKGLSLGGMLSKETENFSLLLLCFSA